MAEFWSKQPNGKYCRLSTCVDCVTHWNIREEQFINMVFGYTYHPRTEDEINTLRQVFKEKYLKPFSEIKERFIPANATIEDFEDVLKEMGDVEGFTEEQLKEKKSGWKCLKNKELEIF